MASIVEIRAATTSVVCDDSGVAQHVINVHNVSGRRLRIGARVHVDAPAEAGWIGKIHLPANERQQEWDLDPDKTIQLTVPIQAGDASAGKYTFRVEVYSTDAPSEDYTTGDGIAFEVKEKPVVTEPKKPFPWWIIAVILAVLVVGGVTWWAIAHFTKATVPDLVGLSQTEAADEIDAAGLTRGDITREVSEDVAPDIVLRQDPPAGERVAKESSVSIVVAEADMTATVPDLGGLTKAAATARLEAAGLKLGNVTTEVNTSTTAGTVLRQSPSSGTSLPRDSSVSVVLAKAAPVAPGIHKQGIFSVRQTWHGDLDSGAETSSGSDFWFRADTATRRFLAPENGATFRVMGAGQPDYFACKDAALSASVIDVTRLRSGTWVCARTSEERYSAFTFTAEIGASPGVMRIRHVTWDKLLVLNPLPIQPGVIHIPPR